MSKKSNKILVTGASGYIGGRLLERLLQQKYDVISMARRPDQFLQRFDISHECRYGNTFEIDSLDNALKDVDTAFYLIHSLNDNDDFFEKWPLTALEIQFQKKGDICR